MAQRADTVRKDTSKHFMIIDARPINKHDKPLYVVDGVIYKGNIRRVNPNDILEVSVLKGDEAAALYGSKAANGVILVTTKQFAQKEYQKKLGVFSSEYKSYLDRHKGDDSDIIYILNGVQLIEYSDRLNKLYKLLADEIKNIGFSIDAIDIRDHIPALIINTKQ